MDIFLKILLAFLIILAGSGLVAVFSYLVRKRRINRVLENERERSYFLYSLYSVAFGKKVRSLRDIYIPSVICGKAVLLKLPLILVGKGGIVVVAESRMCGFIENPMRGDWRQFHGDRIVQFQNPAEKNAICVRALKEALGQGGFTVPAIKGIVVFTDDNVRMKNKLSYVKSPERSVEYIGRFMRGGDITSSEATEICLFLRKASGKSFRL